MKKRRKESPFGVSLLESLFAIVTQRNNRLREKFALASVNFSPFPSPVDFLLKRAIVFFGIVVREGGLT